MARLFVGQREVDYFADISKELIKDVAGQKIYYYTVREDLSDVHSMYEESIEKIFNPPIEIEAAIEWQPSEVKTTRFGTESVKTLTVYLHYRDLFDRGIDFKEGDYFSYGTFFFEATSIIYDKLIFGQIEQQRGIPDHDVRILQKDGVLEAPISGARKVAPDGTEKSVNGVGSSFYGED